MEAELTCSVSSLVQELHTLQLLAAPQLDEVTCRLAPHSRDARALARELVQRNWLTPFQVNYLLDGRGKLLRFGPYLLLERLGEGGSGQVYKARHTRMNRLVALKVLRPELLTDPEVVQRFFREVQVTGQLTSPYIVHAYDSGQFGAAYYMAVEYVEGADLAKLVKQCGPLGVAQACSYIMQAAFGLDHAHLKGLVHRDIKPSNLLVAQKRGGGDQTLTGTRDKKTLPSFSLTGAPSATELTTPWGIVKLLDLGLARVPRNRADNSSLTLTMAGSVMMGTPDYLAPEQALDFHQADIRADVYGLGCTFYFLLTGQPPFAGGTLAQKLMKHQQAPVPSARELRPDLPKELDSILQKMLAKQPADRYQSPAEVAAVLAPLATLEQPKSARGLARFWRRKTPRKPRPAKRSAAGRATRWKWLLGLAAAVLLLTAGLTLVPLMWSGSGDSTEAPQASASPSATRRSSEGRPTPPAREAPVALTMLGEPRGRHWGNVTHLVFSPDGKLLASASQGATIHIWDAGTLAEVRTLSIATRQVGALAFSPDGRRLAAAITGITGQTSEMKVWDVQSGKELKEWTYPGALGLAAAFSADGETLTLVHQRHVPPLGSVIDFRIWEASTGKEKRPPVEAGNSFAGRLSANGAFGLSASANGWKYWDLAKGTSDLDGSLGPNRGMPPHALSADGKTLFMVSQKPVMVKSTFTNELHVIDLGPLPADTPPNNRGQTHNLQEEYNAPLIVPGPRPQTVILLGRSADGTKGALRLWELSAMPKRLALAELPGSVSFLTLSPDGQTLAVASNEGTLRLYDAATLAERFPDTGHRGAVQFLAFAENDQVLVSASLADRTVRAWDPLGGKERGRLTISAPAGGGLGPFFGMNLAHGSHGSGLAVWNNQGIRWLDAVAGKERDIKPADKGLQAVTVAPDGRTLATLAANTLRFWDTATGAAQPTTIASTAHVGNMALSQDGKLLALASQRIENGKLAITVRVLDVATGAERFVVPGTFNGFSSLALSGDGRYLAANFSRLQDKRFQQEWKVWEVATGKERVLLPAPAPGNATLLFAPSGPYLAAWNNSHLDIWDVATGQSRYQLALPAQAGRALSLRSVVFARDGQQLAYAQNDGRVVLIDCEAGKAVGEWKLPGAPTSLALSSDGRQVAVGTPSGLIQVHRLPTAGK